MSQSQLHILGAQSYGYIDGPQDQSTGAKGSRARMDEALAIARTLASSHKVIFLFPQGYQKKNPRVSDNRTMSLGESMAQYVESNLSKKHPQIQVYFEPLSWGTLDDIKSIPQMLGKLGYDCQPHVHFVTDPEHLKRVRLVWKYVSPQGWAASFHPAEQHRMSWSERWIREPIARILYRYRLLLGR